MYTDHRTLENFETQRDLSRRQLHWQELLSQFEMNIVYIKGEDNCVADALSRIPLDVFPGEKPLPVFEVWNPENAVNVVLKLETDDSVLTSIKAGYKSDDFCKRLVDSKMAGVTISNGLIYVGSRLVIPQVADIRENLFRLAYDCLGHFGTDKSYAALREVYYWPNMRRDLEKGYIPACVDCQRNKSRTTKPAGPLHPLPIPERRRQCCNRFRWTAASGQWI